MTIIGILFGDPSRSGKLRKQVLQKAEFGTSENIQSEINLFAQLLLSLESLLDRQVLDPLRCPDIGLDALQSFDVCFAVGHDDVADSTIDSDMKSSKLENQRIENGKVLMTSLLVAIPNVWSKLRCQVWSC